jgi:hypothetical protein
MRSLKVLVPVAIGVAAIAAGIAWAAIPSSDGVITGCYVKQSRSFGKLRVIDAENGQACKSSEASLNWYAKAGADARFARGNVDLPFGRAAMPQRQDCCPNPNPPTILDIPGFVKVQLWDCASWGVSLHVINSSGADLYVSGHPNFLAPNDFVEIQGYEAIYRGQIAPRDPTPPRAVTLTTSAFWDGTNARCAGQAQAIVGG